MTSPALSPLLTREVTRIPCVYLSTVAGMRMSKKKKKKSVIIYTLVYSNRVCAIVRICI